MMNYCYLRRMGPFPAGIILHSYMGSAEMVPEFAKLGSYFSFSGFLMSMEARKAKRILEKVIFHHILSCHLLCQIPEHCHKLCGLPFVGSSRKNLVGDRCT